MHISILFFASSDRRRKQARTNSHARSRGKKTRFFAHIFKRGYYYDYDDDLIG
jgi:hypothetical protein